MSNLGKCYKTWRGECVPPSKVIDGVHHYRVEQVGQMEMELTA